MKTRRHPDDAHGLTTNEAAIVARLEAGDQPGTISRAFGISLATVTVYKALYIIGDEQLNGFDRRTRSSDAAYQAALAASGGQYR